MTNKTSLKIKLAFYGIALTIIPLIAVFAVSFTQSRHSNSIAGGSIGDLSHQDLDHVASGLYTTLETQEQVLQQMVTRSMNVAAKELARSGGISLSEEKTGWKAVNQLDPTDSRQINLPKLLIGNSWPGANTDAGVKSPVVDDVRKMLDVTCTVFQRMDSEGDMLRVVTNVLKADGNPTLYTLQRVADALGKRLVISLAEK